MMANAIGVDPSMCVDPRSAMLFATAHNLCRTCAAKDACHEALRLKKLTVGKIAAFCPSSDILFDLLDRSQPYHA